MSDIEDKVTVTLTVPAGAVPAMRQFARWLRDNPKVVAEDGPNLSGIITRYLWEMDR